MWTNADRAIRALRLNKGWTQESLGARVGVSREMVSRAERGLLRAMTLRSIDRIAEALGASVQVTIRWHGEQLDRLIDAAHAALSQATAALLTSVGWQVRVETSFNHFGDRGRVDILAYHPGLETLMVIEVKSAIGDLQETLGRLDVKCRLARKVASGVGWTAISTVIPALVIGDSRRARRVVADHDALFARFSVRGRSAIAWVRHPAPPTPAGLLWFVKPPDSHPATIARGRRAPKRSASRRA